MKIVMPLCQEYFYTHSDDVITRKQLSRSGRETGDDTMHPLKCGPISKTQKARGKMEKAAVSLHAGNVVLYISSALNIGESGIGIKILLSQTSKIAERC